MLLLWDRGFMSPLAVVTEIFCPRLELYFYLVPLFSSLGWGSSFSCILCPIWFFKLHKGWTRAVYVCWVAGHLFHFDHYIFTKWHINFPWVWCWKYHPSFAWHFCKILQFQKYRFLALLHLSLPRQQSVQWYTEKRFPLITSAFMILCYAENASFMI